MGTIGKDWILVAGCWRLLRSRRKRIRTASISTWESASSKFAMVLCYRKVAETAAARTRKRSATFRPTKRRSNIVDGSRGQRITVCKRQR